jgi:mersacidin/lichenicidin family type 2 lantibiotic
MSRQNIIRAWKDEEYRQSLSATEKETLPPNPAGLPELSEARGGTWIPVGTQICSTVGLRLICKPYPA